jgi:hypothetical protein
MLNQNKMKIIFFFIMILCGTFSTYSQDLIKELKKLTLENDSLKTQVIKPLKKEINEINEKNKNEISLLKIQVSALQKDTVVSLKNKIRQLNKEIVDLNKNKLKNENDSLKIQLKKLADNSIIQKDLNDKNNKVIIDQKNQIKEIAIKENENGKKEVITIIINKYKNRKIDDLIKISTKETLLNDKQLIGNNTEISEILSDLEIYFKGKELLTQKIDLIKLNNTISQINQTKQQSTIIIDLKDKLENNSTLSLKLKETILNIVVYDNKSSKKYMIGEGIDKQTREDKLNKVFSVLMPFISGYDLNFNDYPYLFNIVLDVIKRKQSNTDEDISDLINKL